MKFIFRLTFSWLVSFSLLSCKQDTGMFRLISSDRSGIHFNNKIVENDSINPIDITNIYNGGGVGVGDFNGDGLQDLYFTGSMVSNKLYLNKGNLQFEDITNSAGVGGNGKWCRGVSVVDINNDGWLDMYVCASMDKSAQKRKNLLYINQGPDKKGRPFFKESAAAYGLDDTTHSTMASFFDYDNDGDLDMYLVVNQILPTVNPSVFKPKITDGSFPSTGRLYRNAMDNAAGHPVFTNVTKEAGLTIEGYGHGATICDINKDGWKDIFVTNDFIANDLLYINNGNGTFTDKAASYFKHTSANGMGQDVIDINNDGLSDVIELDMNPEDNYRKKTMMNAGNYRTSQLNNFFKYQYQYVRNTLQVNQGPRVNANDSIGDPVFSDVGYFSVIAETDWSWTPLVADFDNDGLRDLVVSNGFPKDVTDHDFIAFRREPSLFAPQSNMLSKIPEVKLPNYAFHNDGDCRFTDVSQAWGFEKVSFSNGAAYADLDNDGDLDLVINNINDDAFVYENTVMQSDGENHRYLSVQLIGDSSNRNGLGAWIELYYGSNHQAYEQTPYRGYLSTMQLDPHFGFNKVAVVDSVVVKWPDGKKQLLKNVPTNQTLKIKKATASESYVWPQPVFAQNALFTDVTSKAGLSYVHFQQDYIDFNIQKLLPHKFSEYGPSLAAGDVNGDGLDDIIVGGNAAAGAVVLLQQNDGSFKQHPLVQPTEITGLDFQDTGVLLFDADGDGDLDLYAARGGYEPAPNADAYADKFYINNGKGSFKADTAAIPFNTASKFCVRACDYDRDGDLDLFIAGRVKPWNYPQAVSSFIYRNDSKNGNVLFTDVTASVAHALVNVGLTCDALWTDFDNDGWPDLILAGEWMPLQFFKNEHGHFKNSTAATGIQNKSGWWNSITGGDFDNDGDMDYVVGNLGQNSFYKGSNRFPVSVYAKDFDHNGVLECVPTTYIKDTIGGTLKEFTAHTRDDIVDQMPFIKRRFLTYKSFAGATFDQLFSPDERADVIAYKANYFSSSFIRNNGNGTFTMTPLPVAAQYSIINGMVADDFDGDGNLDVCINTNDYGTEVTVGRYDAMNGLLLKGDGNGNFKPQSILQSGIFIPGNGKALVKLRRKNGRYLLAAGQNRGPLKLFELKKEVRNVPILPDDVIGELTFSTGKRQRREFYYGCSFLSQSARFLAVPANVTAIAVYDTKGKMRQLNF